ncbi:MAG: hypothetical protein AAF772_09645 [Acidobacteriota bacterium]
MLPLEQLVNLDAYTPLEMTLFVTGGFLWAIVYLIYLRSIIRDRYLEMPPFAACSNLGWEFTWSFVTGTNMGVLVDRCYLIWFVLDCFIFFGGALRYGRKQNYHPALDRPWVPFCIVTALAFTGIYIAMWASGLDTPSGGNSAYIAQLIISVLYILVVLRGRDLERFSLAVAWLRMLGTGMITIFMLIHPGNDGNYFLRGMACLATSLDCICLVMFYRKRRALAAV